MFSYNFCFEFQYIRSCLSYWIDVENMERVYLVILTYLKSISNVSLQYIC